MLKAQNLLMLTVTVTMTECKSQDCTVGDPDIECEKGWSCHPGTKRCEPTCDSGPACIGGWLRSCAPLTMNINAAQTADDSAETCACSGHSDCSSRLCDFYASPGGNGVCEPAWKRIGTGWIRNVIYVDKDHCRPGGDGSLENPYCQIYQAITQNMRDGFEHPIRVFPSIDPYDGFKIINPTLSSLWIVGPEQDKKATEQVRIASTIEINEELVQRPFRLILDGLRLLNSSVAQNAVRCNAYNQSMTLELRRVNIEPEIDQTMIIPGAAVYVKGCKLIVDRTSIINNTGRGIVLDQNEKNPMGPATSFQISNSIVANNRLEKSANSPDQSNSCDYAICLAGQGKFEFNTIADNARKAVLCGGINVDISNSIVVRNPAGGGAQFDYSGCRFRKTIVGEKENEPFPPKVLEDRRSYNWVRRWPGFTVAKNTPPSPKDYMLSGGDFVEAEIAWISKDRGEIITLDGALGNWDYLGRKRTDAPDIGAFEYIP